jgi:hypothetical protein
MAREEESDVTDNILKLGQPPQQVNRFAPRRHAVM